MLILNKDRTDFHLDKHLRSQSFQLCQLDFLKNLKRSQLRFWIRFNRQKKIKRICKSNTIKFTTRWWREFSKNQSQLVLTKVRNCKEFKQCLKTSKLKKKKLYTLKKTYSVKMNKNTIWRVVLKLYKNQFKMNKLSQR